MKLLIITQKVDVRDGGLGFMIQWIKAFYTQVSKLTVICLEKGVYDLPKDISILSLGKENQQSRIQYTLRFLKYIIIERKNYDTVFVHMNQEYVLLGGIVWKILGKKVLLWRNHPEGSWLTKIAVMFANTVFCTSPFSYTAKFKKTQLMPAGIDTDQFIDTNTPDRFEAPILYLGRISPIKKVGTLLRAIRSLQEAGNQIKLDIYGAPANDPASKTYYVEMQKLKEAAQNPGAIAFLGNVANTKTPEIYNTHGLLVNLTPTGSFDKVILEMMATGGLVLVSNRSFESIFPEEYHEYLLCKENDITDIVLKIKKIIALSLAQKKAMGEKLRQIVITKHSLQSLVHKVLHA